MHPSHVVFERETVLARQADLLPGIYSQSRNARDGYRFVSIPPHLYVHAMHELHKIERDSVIKLEIFLTKIYPVRRRSASPLHQA